MPRRNTRATSVFQHVEPLSGRFPKAYLQPPRPSSFGDLMLPSDAAVPANSLPLASVIPLRPWSRPSQHPIPSELVLDFSTPEQQAVRPLTRRVHAKSRLGCLTCKRRRVKCDETQPVCTQCTRLQLSCAYSGPSNAQQRSRQQQEQKEQHGANRSRICHSIGTALSMEQLKFYDHFIQVAHPLTPIQGRDGYLRCAAMSQEVRLVRGIYHIIGLHTYLFGSLTPLINASN